MKFDDLAGHDLTTADPETRSGGTLALPLVHRDVRLRFSRRETQVDPTGRPVEEPESPHWWSLTTKS